MKTQAEQTKEQQRAASKTVDKGPGGTPATQRMTNTAGLPAKLKAGVERLSGYSMDDVRVHYNSGRPARLRAHAYTQGADIYIAPGQEKHLPHEAWHVVQQKQGRVKPTLLLKGKVSINDDAGLEKEADVMGARANRFIRKVARPEAQELIKRSGEDSIIQRRKKGKKKREIENKGEIEKKKREENRREREKKGLVKLKIGKPGENPYYTYTKEYDENLKKKKKEITKHSGIVERDIATFSDFVIQNDSVVMLRNVNPRAGELLERPDVIGKPMTMKGKSSTGHGGDTTFDPTEGFIPKNQAFSKIPRTEKDKVAKYQRLVNNALNDQEATAVPLTTAEDGEAPRHWYSVKTGTDTYDFIFKKEPDAETYFKLDKETGKEEEPYDLKGRKPEILYVMADPKTGKLYTADYDTLIFAVNADRDELNLKPLPDNYYKDEKRGGVDKAMRDIQENLLNNTLQLIPDQDIKPLKGLLNEALELQKELNKFDQEDKGKDQEEQGQKDARKAIVRGLTEALRKVYREIEQFLNGGSVRGKTKNAANKPDRQLRDQLRKLQTSIEDTVLETPDLSQVRSVIFEDEEAAITHLNKATGRAIWHASETTNKGGFKEELYEDLKGGVVVFTPNGDIKLIRADTGEEAEKMLVDEINELRKQGYAIFPNPRWGWRADKIGELYIPQGTARIDMNKLKSDIDKEKNEDKKRGLLEKYDQLIAELEKEYAQNEHFKEHWNKSHKGDAQRQIKSGEDIGDKIGGLIWEIKGG